ncbi:MAG: DUF192 domain-containing protein [Microcoleaceae cyanobacterium]
MEGNIILFKLGINLLLVSYSLQMTPVLSPEIFLPQAQAQQLPDTQESKKGQALPITAEAIISNQKINLEVAKTPQEKAIGLMYRNFLPDDRGMLFSFNPPRQTNFWMKNCLISLDMIFIRSGIVRAIAENVPPCVADPCPTYGPNVPIDQVIELRGGRAAELELKVGDRIVIKPNS